MYTAKIDLSKVVITMSEHTEEAKILPGSKIRSLYSIYGQHRQNVHCYIQYDYEVSKISRDPNGICHLTTPIKAEIFGNHPFTVDIQEENYQTGAITHLFVDSIEFRDGKPWSNENEK